MTLNLADIVSVEDADPARPTAALGRLRAAPSRRSVLRMLGVSALVLGGNVLSWGSRPLSGIAAAERQVEYGPGGGHSGWMTCMFDYIPERDAGGRYRGWRGACNGQNYISSTTCRSSGWHRFDTIHRLDGAVVDYRLVNHRCWGQGLGFASRNAWRWRPPGGHEYRCSDGQMVVTLGGRTHTYNSTCRWMVGD